MPVAKASFSRSGWPPFPMGKQRCGDFFPCRGRGLLFPDVVVGQWRTVHTDHCRPSSWLWWREDPGWGAPPGSTASLSGEQGAPRHLSLGRELRAARSSDGLSLPWWWGGSSFIFFWNVCRVLWCTLKLLITTLFATAVRVLLFFVMHCQKRTTKRFIMRLDKRHTIKAWLPCKSLLRGLCRASGQKMHDKTIAMRFSGLLQAIATHQGKPKYEYGHGVDLRSMLCWAALRFTINFYIIVSRKIWIYGEHKKQANTSWYCDVVKYYYSTK
jgi:hypothetical protein